MCSPMIAVLAASAGGSLISANASRQAGQAQKAIADENAAIANAQGQSSYAIGAEKEGEYANNLAELQGRAKAAAAASGFVGSKGSPLDLMVQSAGFGKRDLIQIGNNAAMEAYGYQARAVNFTNQGALDLYEGNQKAGATLLSGLSQFGTQYKMFGPTG